MAERPKGKRRICHDAYEKEYSGWPGWMGTYAMPGVRVRVLEDTASFSSASAGRHCRMFGMCPAERGRQCTINSNSGLKIMVVRNIVTIVYMMMNALVEWSVMDENPSNRIVSEGSRKIFLIWKLLKQTLKTAIFECKKYGEVGEWSGKFAEEKTDRSLSAPVGAVGCLYKRS